jgi:hypothetical protein
VKQGVRHHSILASVNICSCSFCYGILEQVFKANRNKEPFTDGVKADILWVRRLVPLNPSVILKMYVWIFLGRNKMSLGSCTFVIPQSIDCYPRGSSFFLQGSAVWHHRKGWRIYGVLTAKILCMYATHGWERKRCLNRIVICEDYVAFGIVLIKYEYGARAGWCWQRNSIH